MADEIPSPWRSAPAPFDPAIKIQNGSCCAELNTATQHQGSSMNEKNARAAARSNIDSAKAREKR
jgi:hypothetical protein